MSDSPAGQGSAGRRVTDEAVAEPEAVVAAGAILREVATESPRARLVAALTEAIAAAMSAGDLHAARVAHEALGRLIAEPARGLPGVADLGAARAKRGQP